MESRPVCALHFVFCEMCDTECLVSEGSRKKPLTLLLLSTLTRQQFFTNNDWEKKNPKDPKLLHVKNSYFNFTKMTEVAWRCNC